EEAHLCGCPLNFGQREQQTAHSERTRQSSPVFCGMVHGGAGQVSGLLRQVSAPAAALVAG
ncbi:MAG: hypothetical protein ACLFU4_03870, partial [Opitutales bacterium]